MPCDKTATIDMDQEVALGVVVTVSMKYDYDTKQTLSQTITAPLYIIKNVKIAAIAETLCQRAIQKFISALREQEERRIHEEESATKNEETETS